MEVHQGQKRLRVGVRLSLMVIQSPLAAIGPHFNTGFMIKHTSIFYTALPQMNHSTMKQCKYSLKRAEGEEGSAGCSKNDIFATLLFMVLSHSLIMLQSSSQKQAPVKSGFSMFNRKKMNPSQHKALTCHSPQSN